MGENKKTETYKWIKIAGILSFIPFVLASGPIAGFFLGDICQKKFNTPPYLTIIFVTVGFAGSVMETIRIIKVALRSDK